MVTKRNRPQVNAGAIRGPALDTFRALNVPFKGAPKLSGVGDNYRRLAESLGRLGSAMGDLGSLGAALDKKNKTDAADLAMQYEMQSYYNKLTPEQAADFRNKTGTNPVSDEAVNITRLETELAPQWEKEAEDRRVARETDPHGWEIDEETYDEIKGDPSTVKRPMTEADVNAEWDLWIVQNAQKYSSGKAFRPQFDKVIAVGNAQRKKDLEALNKANELKNFNQAASIAAGNATGIAVQAAAGDVSDEDVGKVFNSNVQRITNEFGKYGPSNPLNGEQKLTILRGAIDKVNESAKSDPEAADAAQRLVRGAKTDQGVFYRDHPKMKDSMERLDRTAANTLAEFDKKRREDVIVENARTSGLPLSQLFQDEEINITDAFGNVIGTKKISGKDLRDRTELMLDNQEAQKASGNTLLSERDIIRGKITTANRRGYVSPSVKNFFEGPVWQNGIENDPTKLAEFSSKVDVYRMLREEAPQEVTKYVKDAATRNFLEAVLTRAEYEKGRPIQEIAAEVQNNTRPDGKTVNAISNWSEEFRDWRKGPIGAKLSARDLEDFKGVFNSAYGSVRDIKNVESVFDTIGTNILKNSIEINGGYIPSANVPPGFTVKQFEADLKEVISDYLVQHVPDKKLNDVTIVSAGAGNAILLKDRKTGHMLTAINPETGERLTAKIALRDVETILNKKRAPARKADEAARRQHAQDIVSGKKTGTPVRSGEPVDTVVTP